MCAKVAVADLEKFNYSQILPPSFLSIFSVSFLRFFWKSTYMEKFFWQKKCKIKAHSVDSFGASLTLKKKFSTMPGGSGRWKEILTFCTLNIVLSSRSNTGLQKNIYSSTFYIVRLLTGPLRDQKIFYS